MTTAPVTPVLRDLDTIAELRACVELQETVWGKGFSERAPVSLLTVARRLGGVVAGAFGDGGALLGFVFGLTGLTEGRVVHWSDMLAVRPGLRDMGLGTRLKTYQRARCLEMGIRRIYWSFDPLEARNGWLNLGKLGAVAREYVPDMYGAGDSPLHRGLGTDRLVALWPLDSPRVRGRLAGRGPAAAAPGPDVTSGLPAAFTVEDQDGLPAPGVPREVPVGAPRVVPVPTAIQEIKDAHLELAVSWREAVRAALGSGLSEGLDVTELVRSPGAVHHLLLQPRQAWGDAPGGAAQERAASPEDPAP